MLHYSTASSYGDTLPQQVGAWEVMCSMLTIKPLLNVLPNNFRDGAKKGGGGHTLSSCICSPCLQNADRADKTTLHHSHKTAQKRDRVGVPFLQDLEDGDK